MSSGLYINTKKDRKFLHWIILGFFAILIVIGIYYGYQWFTKGDQPPLIPLPASALADPTVDESPVSQTAIDNYTVAATHPRYISIPTLSIDKARVQQVGLTKENMLDTPKNISDTAWYTKSATPGQGYGSVLIDGHNGGISRNGVFVNLDKLKEGDEIGIERGDGKQIKYKVVENRTMSLQEANTTGMKELMTPYESGKEGLGLITCAGKWVPRDKVFDKRILIRAVVIDE